MADSITQKARIKLRMDTLANWKSNNPILLTGEVGFVKETGAYKVGISDSTSSSSPSHWNDLPFQSSVVKKNGDPTTSDSDYEVGTLWFNSKEGTLFCLDKNSNWSKMALDDDLQELKEKLNDYMLTEEYVGDTAINAVKMADTVKVNGSYAKVDDSSTDGLWSAEHTDDEIASAKEEAVTDAVSKIKELMGAAKGIATLDENKLIPSSQLPSYVDDVVSVPTYAKLTSDAQYKVADKIFIVKTATDETGGQEHTQWRWVDSSVGFVQITSGLITVDDKTSVAYSHTNGAANREVLNAVTLTINGTAFADYNQEAAVKKGTISDRLDTLETFIDSGIKDCVKVRGEVDHDTSLITEGNLSEMCVTNDKLALDAVGTNNIIDYNVTTKKLAKGAVTGDQIATGVIMLKHLAGEVTRAIENATGSTMPEDVLTENCIVSDYIADEAVTNDKIESVSVSKLTADSTVTLILDCGKSS